MRIFVTGATGFIGAEVTRELLAAGHRVLGLARSPAGVAALAALGAEVHEGRIEDVEGLRAAAAGADGVIHLAFNHDFSRFAQNCEDDRRVVAALGAALAGSGRPLIVTSGTAAADHAPGQPAREEDPAQSAAVMPRAATEEAAAAAAAGGVALSVVRLPQVHDTRRQGLITPAIAIAREKGVVAYVGDGRNRWPAAHLLDVARLYRLAIERAAPDAVYHAVAEEGIAMRAIAETIGRRLGLPTASLSAEEAGAHFGWLARLMTADLPASSDRTRRLLDWQPAGRGLIADLEELEVADPAEA